jgi:ferredoxin
MRVAVDDDRCRGHSVCCSICPEVFVLSDDGYAEVPEPQVPVRFESAVQQAVGSCPERAITVS